jgi:hypothetical protein
MQDLEIHGHYREIHLEFSVLVFKENKKRKSKIEMKIFDYRAVGFVHCFGISDRSFNGVIGIGTLDNDAIESFKSPTFGSLGYKITNIINNKKINQSIFLLDWQIVFPLIDN